MNKDIHDAMNEINDQHLAEAENYIKHRNPYWIAAAAAIFALVIGIWAIAGRNSKPTKPELYVPGNSAPSTAHPSEPERNVVDLLAGLDLPDLQTPAYFPAMIQHPNYDDYGSDWRGYSEAEKQWYEYQHTFYNQPDGYADSLTDFFASSIPQFLSGEENGAYSPVNVYLAMALLAETTAGNSRQEILDLFGLNSIEQLRQQASYLWNAHYNNDGQTTLLLGNSLWLDNAFGFQQETVDNLATNYYASTFHSDLGTDASNAQLQAWLDAMTGGLLKEQAKNVKLSPDAAFALASTIYFKAGWLNEFPKSQTAEDIFHATSGDMTATFMRNHVKGNVYRGTNFRAVRLGLTGNNDMWIILPDEGVSLSEVLSCEEYLNMTLDPNGWSEYTNALIHIALPKFDITSQCDLINGMKNLGVQDIFHSDMADFSPMIQNNPVDGNLYVSQINHAARVKIDEKGVEAAAFTVLESTTDSAPTQMLEFVVDRPFLFIVSSRDHLPLFAGAVVQP